MSGKMCQNTLPSGVGRSLGAKISGGRVIPGKYFLVSTKLDTFCYPAVQTVRPSVRLCVTSRCSTETAKRRITQTSHAIAPGTLVF